MTLQASGAISLSDIATEYGGTVPHSISEYYGADAAGTIPASGVISFDDFYGTSNWQDIAVFSSGNYNNIPSGNGIQQTSGSDIYGINNEGIIGGVGMGSMNSTTTYGMQLVSLGASSGYQGWSLTTYNSFPLSCSAEFYGSYWSQYAGKRLKIVFEAGGISGQYLSWGQTSTVSATVNGTGCTFYGTNVMPSPRPTYTTYITIPSSGQPSYSASVNSGFLAVDPYGVLQLYAMNLVSIDIVI